MEVSERIRYLRQHELTLSQKAFGEKIGVSRDTINNIENDRLKKPEQKEPVYRLICQVFGISKDWLMTGEGDMKTNNGLDAEFDLLCTEIQLSDDAFIKNALRAYWHLDAKEKAVIKKLINDLASEEG